MKTGIFVLLFMLLSSNVFAADVTLIWNGNLEKDLAGYRLYQSSVSGNYDITPGNEIADIPAGIEFVSIIVSDGVWYWVLTAYDTHDNMSPISQEVFYDADSTPPGAVSGFRISSVEEDQ